MGILQPQVSNPLKLNFVGAGLPSLREVGILHRFPAFVC